MQDSYNNNNNNDTSYPRIPTEETTLFIPECVNWSMINSVESTATNYRERLITENANNSYSNISDVPVAHSFTRKRGQFQFKSIFFLIF